MLYKRCCICGRLITGKQYDARPYKNGVCCQMCNDDIVLSSRRNSMLKKRRWDR